MLLSGSRSILATARRFFIHFHPVVISVLFLALTHSARAQFAGNALHWDGATNYVRGVPSNTVGTNYTVEAWVRPNTTSNGVQTCIFSTREGGNAFDFKLVSGSQIHGDIGDGATTWLSITADVSMTYSTNVWYHIAYSVTPTNYTIYTNGLPAATGTYGASATPVLFSPALPLRVGTSGTGEYWNGDIDEVRVWNTNRSDAQILSYYQTRAYGGEPNLAMLWHFDETGGTTAIDNTTNGITGSYFGNPVQLISTAPLTAFGVTLSLTNLAEGPALGTDSVAVISIPATNAIPWTATTNASWLHLVNSSGQGNGAIRFTFDANAGATRTGTITVANNTITITQAGSAYIAPYTVTNPLVLFTNLATTNNYITTDNSGNIYLIENGAVKKWTVGASSLTTLVSSGLSNPTGLAIDSSNNVYIADTGHAAVKKWIAASNTVVTLVSSGLGSPSGIALDRSGNIYVSDSASNAVLVCSPTGGALTNLITGLLQPTALVFDAAGDLYVANSGTNCLSVRLAASGTVTNLYLGPSVAARYLNVWVDLSENVYGIRRSSTGLLIEDKWAPGSTGSTVTTTNFLVATSTAVDSSGDLFFSKGTLTEVVRAFIAPTNVTFGTNAGSYTLPAVLPATANLTGVFQPASDQSWLAVSLGANDTITVNYTSSALLTSNRTANLVILGQTNTFTQLRGITLTPVVANAQTLPLPNSFAPTNQLTASGVAFGATNFTIAISPAQGTLQLQPGFATNGLFQYIPGSNYLSASDSFTFTASDNYGDVSSPATVTLTVSNNAIAFSQTLNLLQDQLQSNTLAGFVVSGKTNFSIVQSPANGQLLFNAGFATNGLFLYRPTVTNFVGTDSFQFKVTTDQGATSALAVVSINVSSNFLSAFDQFLTWPQYSGAPTSQLTGFVLAGPTNFVIVRPPTYGQVTQLPGFATNGLWTFLPPRTNFSGSDSFTFVVTNNLGQTSGVATVSIYVPVVEKYAPFAHPQFLKTRPGQSIPVYLSGDDDANDGSSTNAHTRDMRDWNPVFTLLTSPTNGTLSGTAPDLTYTPTKTNVFDSFTFKVSNEVTDSAPATVLIRVAAYNSVLSYFNNNFGNVPPNTNHAADVPSANLGTVRPGYESPALMSNNGPIILAEQEGTSGTGRYDDTSLNLTNTLDRLGRPRLFNFFGQSFTNLYVNNNGMLSFTAAVQSFAPTIFPSNNYIALAPLWCDVDTRSTARGGVASYGQGYVSGGQGLTGLTRGRPALFFTWNDVAGYNMETTKLNRFQCLLVDRSDIKPGFYDAEFNFEYVEWFVGDASPTSYPVSGYNLNSGTNYYNFTGSGTTSVASYVTNSDTVPPVPGRYYFHLFKGQDYAPSISNAVITATTTNIAVSATVNPNGVWSTVYLQLRNTVSGVVSNYAITNLPSSDAVLTPVQGIVTVSNLPAGLPYALTVMIASEMGESVSTNLIYYSTAPRLASLQINPNGVLIPAFNSNITSYACLVINSSVTVNATLENPSTNPILYQINGAAYSTNNVLPLPPGITNGTVNILATSSTGETNLYTVNISRPASTNSFLTSLVTPGIPFTFSSGSFNYTLFAGPATSITVNALATSSNASIQTASGTNQLGSNSVVIPLSPGTNTIPVVVAAEDGIHVSTYTLSVIATGPPILTLFPATSVTSSNAVMNATINPQGDTTTVYFQFGPTTNYNRSNAVVLSPLWSAQPVQLTLTNLLPGTIYHYRAVANNGSGTITATDATFETVHTNTLLAALSYNQLPLHLFTATNFNYTNTFGHGLTNLTVYDYTNSVQASNLTLILSAVAADPRATVQIAASTPVLSSNSLAVDLAQRTNLFSIVVTAQDGSSNVYHAVFYDGSPFLSGSTVLDNGGAFGLFRIVFSSLINPEGISCAGYFQYGLTTNYEANSVTNSISSTATNFSSANLTNFYYNSTYHYRGVASNFYGVSYGADQTFVTKLDALYELSSLTTTAGLLFPPFAITNANVAYTNWIAHNVTNLTVFAQALSTNATVQINFNTPILFSNSYSLFINQRTTSISIVITPQDTNWITFYPYYAIDGSPFVTTQSVSAITATNATLNASVHPEGANSTLYFIYGLDTNYGSSTPISTVTLTNTPQPVAAGISNLLAGTLYHFTTVVSNAYGLLTNSDQTLTTISTNSSLATLTLSQGSLAPVFAPSTLSYAVNFTNLVTNVTINASAAFSNATIKVASGSAVAGSNSTPVTLAAGTNTVSIMVTAQDNSTTTYTLTLTVGHPPILSALSASAITKTSALLNVTADPQNLASSIYFQFGGDTNYGQTTDTNLISGSSQPVSLTTSNLATGALYHYRAVATNAAGQTVSGDLTFVTSGLKTALTIGRSFNSNQFFISWTTNAIGGVIESATDIYTVPVIWQTVTNPISLQGGSNTIIISPVTQWMFYRINYP